MDNCCKSDLVYGDLAESSHHLDFEGRKQPHQSYVDLVRRGAYFWMFSHRGWEVVVDPDMYTAETLQVDVHNTELTLVESSRFSCPPVMGRCWFIRLEDVGLFSRKLTSTMEHWPFIDHL